MIVDANLLLYAVDSSSPFHASAAAWLEDVLNGDAAVGLPWQTIGAFVRISTHPRAATNPLTGEKAWEYVESWLAAEPAWIPPATRTTARVYGELARMIPITGNLVTDGMHSVIAQATKPASVPAASATRELPLATAGCGCGSGGCC